MYVIPCGTTKSSTLPDSAWSVRSNIGAILFLIRSVVTQLIGEYGNDVFHLGKGLSIANQVFAQVTSFNKLQACQGEEGLLGLLLTGAKVAKFPTLIDNLKGLLRHPIFSLYLDKTDDYPKDPGKPVRDPANGPGHEYDGTVDSAAYRPQSAHSEIIFGGVNHQHYQGCLKWYDVVDTNPYWSLRLKGVRVADQDLPNSDVAVIDSGATFIEGHTDAVAKFAVLNNIKCFVLNESGNAFTLPCDDPGGFDAAVAACDHTLEPLQFVTEDGATYEVGADELFNKVDTANGEVCFLRILSSPELPGWILGDAFLSRHYTAYNFVDRKIGLAETSAKNGGSFCAEDWPLDIAYDGKPAPEPVPTKVPAVAPHVASHANALAPANKPALFPKDNRSPVAGLATYKSLTAGSSSSKNNMNLSIGIAVVIVVAAILMVTVILRRRRQRYERADRYDEEGYAADDVRETELPGLL